MYTVLPLALRSHARVHIVSGTRYARRPVSSVSKKQRLSQIWVPTGGLAVSGESNESLSLLVRAGFLRQAYSGVFHLLPLGLRVQNKLEALVDKHMQGLNASKLALSSITSEALWRQSGRFTGDNPEMFRLSGPDRTGYLLGPTHEEEITNLIAGTVSSYKDLPLRLYQVSRKYRNELRPRGGLLRTREFLMKDLYTFDANADDALETYTDVKQAYVNFFNELKIKYLVADADSGAMGGNLSHEFHFATPAGEDNVWSCDSCAYVANEELVARRIDSNEINMSLDQSASWLGTTVDKKSLVLVLVPQTDLHDTTAVDVSKLNSNSLKRALPLIDLSISGISGEGGSLVPVLDQAIANEGEPTKTVLHILIDSRISALREGVEPLLAAVTQSFASHGLKADFSKLSLKLVTTDLSTNKPLILNNPRPGDGCPSCPTGSLKVDRAVELGHTFHLGTRYSAPLNALVEVPKSGGSPSATADAVKPTEIAGHRVPISMGCHGIGISRLIGAIASVLSDSSGLNWPRVVAPYEVIVVPANPAMFEAAAAMQTILTRPFSSKTPDGEAEQLDVVLDDREGQQLGYKLKDADLIGYPIIVVIGRGWKNGMIEVQCRRLGVKEEVEKEKLRSRIRELLGKL